jgi:hypothetical protein
MPRVIKDEIVKCEMSDYTLSMYTFERMTEIDKEQKKNENNICSILYIFMELEHFHFG